MKKIFTALRRSLSARLSFAVVLFVAVIFVGAFSIMFSEARDIIREEAWGKATQTLDGTVLHIDNTLRRVEVASDNQNLLAAVSPSILSTIKRKAVTSRLTPIITVTVSRQNRRAPTTTSTTVWTGI